MEPVRNISIAMSENFLCAPNYLLILLLLLLLLGPNIMTRIMFLNLNSQEIEPNFDRINHTDAGFNWINDDDLV